MSIDPDAYRVEYRRKADSDEEELSWFSQETTEEQVVLRDLEPETTYEVRVASLFSSYVSRYSTIQTFTTPEVIVAACGAASPSPITASTVPLPTAMAGQYWQVGDFEMQVREVRGGDGVFSGWGVMSVPYLNVQIPVKFDQVWVDEDYNLVRGEVIALSEGLEGFQERWQEKNPEGDEESEGDSPVADDEEGSQNGPGDEAEVTSVTVAGEVVRVYVNEQGEVVAVDEEGNEEVVAEQVPEEGEALAVQDSQGNSFTVDSSGAVSSGDASAGDSPINNDVDIEQELIKELLDHFQEEINTFLENKDKGPLDQAVVKQMMNLPECLPQEESQLEAVLVKIDYFIEHRDELIALVAQNEADKARFDELVRKLNGKSPPYREGLDEIEWDELIAIVCPYLVPDEIMTEGFTATLQGDTISNEAIYLVSGSQIELMLAYYSKIDQTEDITFKVSVEEESTNIKMLYPSKDGEKGKRNKPWTLTLEPVKEGKYTITHKIGDQEKKHEFWVRKQKYKHACKVCGRDLKVTRDKLLQLFPSSQFVEVNTSSTEYFKIAVEGAELNTCYRQAHFFSQIDHESNGLTAKIEYTNYDVEGLLDTWKGNSHSKDIFFKQSFWDNETYLDYANLRLFKVDSTGEEAKYVSSRTTAYKWSKNSSNKITVTRHSDFEENSAGHYIRTEHSRAKKLENGKRLLNFVYASPVGTGNGGQASGDGYKYRGRGAIMLTGRGNYKEVSDKCNTLFGTNYDWEENPDQVKSDPKAVVLSASAFIVNRLGTIDKLDTECTSENGYDKCVRPITKLVNGKYIGINDRKEKFKELIEGMFDNCKAKK